MAETGAQDVALPEQLYTGRGKGLTNTKLVIVTIIIIILLFFFERSDEHKAKKKTALSEHFITFYYIFLAHIYFFRNCSECVISQNKYIG